MSNFLIFKAAFNNSATPAIGTYTAEGATALFNRNTSISPDYYLYNTADNTAVQWFVPTAETTDFEFVADILTREWTNRVTYFIIADSTGTTKLRMWSQYSNWYFENSDSTGTSGSPEYIGVIDPTTSGGFGVFHQFRVRVRKLTASSSSVEVYVDGTLKLTATAGAALITCAKIGFVGGVNTFGPGNGAGIKNAYVYDLSGGDVIDRGVLSGAFNRFISWMKSKFALKSDIPTVNDATLTIQQNGTNVQTFTANASTNATANIQCVDLSTAQTVAGNKTFSNGLFASLDTQGDLVTLTDLSLNSTNEDANGMPLTNHVNSIRIKGAQANVLPLMTVTQVSAIGDTSTEFRVYKYKDLSKRAGINIYYTYANDKAQAYFYNCHITTSGNGQYDIGAPSYQFGTAYIKALNINGTAAGDILTHNAAEFVDVTSAQTIAGDKDFTGTTGTHDVIPATTDTYDLGSSAKEYNNAYIKALTVNGTAAGDILTHNASEFVPVTGGAVLSGDLGRTADNSALVISGGTSRSYGACIELDGYSSSVNSGYVLLVPNDRNSYKTMTIKPDGTWSWNGTAVQIISDQRLKQQISEIDDKLLDAWQDVEPVQFRYNDAVDQKGKDKARLHTGYVVQQIDKACKEHGVDISAYGLYCHEEYPEETEEVEIEQEDGTKAKERKVIREANEHYSLRYTETLVVECKYLRRCIARLTARIEQLEKDKEQEANK